jgi:hypothetical protein
MLSELPVLIKEFENLRGVWRIDWLGRIVPRGVAGPVPRIAVHLAELQPAYEDPLSNLSLAQPHRTEQVLVDVGLITLLKIGSVWRNGVQVLPPKALAREQAVVHWKSFQLVKLDGSIELNGRSVPLMPPARHRVGGAAYRDIAGSWVAVAICGTPDGSSRVLLIPSTVLFQATIASSPAATRRLIQGEISKIVDANYGMVVGEPSAFRIELFKNFCDQEAPAIANLLADPVATAEYRRMRHHMVASSVNHSGPGEPKLHIRFGLPFSNEATLRLVGKRIAFDGERDGLGKTVWGFLATQILALNVPLVFSRLVIDRKNDGRQGANASSEDLEDAWSTGGSKPTTPSGPPQPLTSDEAPGLHLDNIVIQAAAVFAPVGLEVLKEEKDVQQYRGARLIPSDGEPFNGLASTTDPHGTAGVAPVNVDLVSEPVVPVTLQHLFDALNVLASEGLNFGTMVVSPSHHRRPADGHVVNYFRAKDRGARSWRRMSDDVGHTRGFVIAEVYLGGVWRYIIDVEHKRAGELSMLLVHAEHGGRIEARRFDYFMEAVARHNGWQAAEEFSSYWRFATIRHAKLRGAEALAKLIRKTLA